MNQCHSPPSRLYYFGPLYENQPLRAFNSYKLGGSEEVLLNLDLAKDQLKYTSNGPYIPLFTNTTAAGAYSAAQNVDEEAVGRRIMCEVDTKKLNGTKLYKVTDIASRMGSAITKAVPDYFARGVIPREAIHQVS